MRLAKWAILDSSKENCILELRFDELTQLLLDGKIHNSDLVRQPNQDDFVPVKYCQALSYYNMKLKQQQIINKIKTNEDIHINLRIFTEKYEGFFQKKYFEKKYSLFKRYEEQIKLILEKKEVIIYSALPLSRWSSSNAVNKGNTLLVFTDKRAIELTFDQDKRYLKDIKFFFYKNICNFEWKEDILHNKYLCLHLNNSERLSWKGLKKYEIDRICKFLYPYIIYNSSFNDVSTNEFKIPICIDSQLLEEINSATDKLCANRNEEDKFKKNIFSDAFKILSYKMLRVGVELFFLVAFLLIAFIHPLKIYFIIFIIFGTLLVAEIVFGNIQYVHRTEVR